MIITYKPKLIASVVQTVFFAGGAVLAASMAGAGIKVLLWFAVAVLLTLAFSAGATALAAIRGGGEIKLDQEGLYVPRTPAETRQVFIPYGEIDDLRHRKSQGNHMLDIYYAGGKVTVESDGMSKRRQFAEFMAALVAAVKAVRGETPVEAQAAPDEAYMPAPQVAAKSAGHYEAHDPLVETYDYTFGGKKALKYAAFFGFGALVGVFFLLTNEGGVRINGIAFGPVGAKILFIVLTAINGFMTMKFLRHVVSPPTSAIPVALGPDGLSAPEKPNAPGHVLLDYGSIRKVKAKGKAGLKIVHAGGALELKAAAFQDKAAFERLTRSLKARLEMGAGALA